MRFQNLLNREVRKEQCVERLSTSNQFIGYSQIICGNLFPIGHLLLDIKHRIIRFTFYATLFFNASISSIVRSTVMFS